MNDPMLQGVLKRVEHLERQNRRLKLGGLAVLTALGVLLGLGAAAPQEQPKVVEAERFVVRDGEGTVRAVLGAPDVELRGALKMDERGTLLALYNTRGKVRAVLGIGTEGPQRVEVPRLELRDVSGGPRVDLRVDASGPGLLLADDRAQARAALSLVRERPTLFLQDPESEARTMLQVAPGGQNQLSMLDARGKLRASLYAATEDASLRLHDADGRLRIELGKSQSGGAGQGLTLYDARGTWRAMLDLREQGPVFDLGGAYGGLFNWGTPGGNWPQRRD